MYDLNKSPMGIYEKALPNWMNWEEKLNAAKEAGFDYLEISVDESDERLSRLDWSKEERRNLKNLIDETGILIPSMCLSGHRRFPLGSENEETRKKAFEIMKKAIEFSVDTGIRIIQLAGYDVYYEEANEKTKALFIEGLRQAISWASKAGVMLAVEIMDTEFIGTILKALPYVREFNSPWFKIYPDLGNITQWSNDVPTELEVGLEHVVAIHVKETLPGKFKCVPFGQGTVDFKGLFNRLKEIGYNGPFMIEMWSDNKKVSTEEVVKEIKNARIWVEERMKEGGFCA